MNRGRSAAKTLPDPPTPETSSTAWMPTSWSAMYGIVATNPVIGTASDSPREPCRPETKSAGGDVAVPVAHRPQP